MSFPEAGIERVAKYFRALSEPTRLRIFNALRGSLRTGSELTEILGCNQPNISKPLKVRVETGIVAREVDGNCALVSMTDPCLDQLRSLVCQNVMRDLEQQATLHQRVLKVRR